MRHLGPHVEIRSGATSVVIRYRTGDPVGRRHYNYLRERFRPHLPRAATLGVTAHWLRHTTLPSLERESGCAVVRAFARHQGTTRSAGFGCHASILTLSRL
ncbi:hypothetical protein APR12_006851 [Nocardia amikacinitolerans]|nr:hypothetical protein [Nocardia amikacinitolerans]